MDTLEMLRKKYEELGEEIERLKTEKENKVWKPKYGDSFWVLSHTGGVVQARWINGNLEDDMYAIGNVFKTKEEAKFRGEQLKVEAELRRFARPFKSDSENYTLQYWQDDDILDITCFELLQCGNVYFPSRKIAQQAIDTVGAERIKKYYFGVED